MLLQCLVLFGLAFAATFAVVAWPEWVALRDETRQLADAHFTHQVAHPGWSFPGRVWSAPAPLDLPARRLSEHARLRGYAEACPPAGPGQYCEKTGEVVPRGGRFAEGEQPPGVEGWTRPLALEPVLLGALVGPDSEIREHLPLADAPDHLVAAIIAAEDGAFYQHGGVDFVGMARASLINLRGGAYQQGASTLTMQVVRNLSQDKEKTVRRKVREMGQAIALDRLVGKEAVLQAYLDAPYLGQAGNFSICGFRAAAHHYFGVDATELSLGQSATLAAILPAPGKFAPDRYPERAAARRDRVLDAMALAGWDVAAARSEPVVSEPQPLVPPPRYPAYFQATRSWLEQNLAPEVVYGSGLEVYTALDLVAQEEGDALMGERVPYLEKAVGSPGMDDMQAAAALVDPWTGGLVAAFGGTVEASTDFNRATQAKRQAGSSFKPVVYAMAFDRSYPRVGASPDPLPYSSSTTMPNSPRVFPGTDGWSPRNVGGEYTTTASLAYALSWSQNIATASLLEDLGGPEPLIAFATRLGFDTSAFKPEMGLALGQAEVTPLEMARFVATVVNGGIRVDGSPVDLARDLAGVERYRRPTLEQAEATERVLSPNAAALTRDLMRLVIEYGTGGAARSAAGFPGYAGPSLGKTGTTDREKDLWFVGGTPRYAGSVWIGYDQPTHINASASDLAAPLWGWWMRAVSLGFDQTEDFPEPKLVHRAICTISGKYGNGTCRLVGAPFVEGDTPKGACPIEHPPAPAEGAVGPDGEPLKKKHESLWKKKAREAAEAEAAEAEEESAAGG